MIKFAPENTILTRSRTNSNAEQTLPVSYLVQYCTVVATEDLVQNFHTVFCPFLTVCIVIVNLSLCVVKQNEKVKKHINSVRKFIIK
jgi:hypothetical protein